MAFVLPHALPPRPQERRNPRPAAAADAGVWGGKTDEGLALGVLRGTTCTVQTCLLTLDSTSVAGQAASLLQLGALLRVVLVQGAGDSQTHRTSLAGRAAAGQGCLDVELVLALQQDQRILDELLVELVREVILQCAAIAGDLAGAL